MSKDSLVSRQYSSHFNQCAENFAEFIREKVQSLENSLNDLDKEMAARRAKHNAGQIHYYKLIEEAIEDLKWLYNNSSQNFILNRENGSSTRALTIVHSIMNGEDALDPNAHENTIKIQIKLGQDGWSEPEKNLLNSAYQLQDQISQLQIISDVAKAMLDTNTSRKRRLQLIATALKDLGEEIEESVTQEITNDDDAGEADNLDRHVNEKYVAKIQRQASVGVRTSSFFREMRNIASNLMKNEETTRKTAAENHAEKNALTDTSPTIDTDIVVSPAPQKVQGPWLSKYEIMHYNIRAGAMIMTDRIADAAPSLLNKEIYNLDRVVTGRTPAAIIEGRRNIDNFSENLAKCVEQEVGKTPLELYNELRGTSHPGTQLPVELVSKIEQAMTINTFRLYFSSISRDNHLQYHKFFEGLSTLCQDLEANLDAKSAKANTAIASYTVEKTIRALDVLFELDEYMRKATLEECKIMLKAKEERKELSPEKVAEYKQAIREQETILAARRTLSAGSNTQLYIAALSIGALGAFAGAAVGAGGAAGIGAGISEPAREALLDLLKGAPAKFMDGLVAGNPILIITVIAGVLGLTGFAAGYFLAAEGSGRIGGGKEANEVFEQAVNKQTADLAAAGNKVLDRVTPQ